jgi:hypothetical protein
MTSFRIFLVLTLLLLVGCATTKGKYGEDLNQPCRGAEYGFGYSDSDVVVNTSETELFYSDVPIKTFSGIQSASLSGSELIISPIDRSLHEQYSAPIVATLYEKKYKAHPFKSLFYTIFTGGIFILKAPREFIPYTFGCTSKTFTSSEPDLPRKVKTGKIEWRNILDSDTHHRYLVSGFNRDYEYKGENNIDLTQAILATNLTGSSNLKITCFDCDLLGPEEQKLYKDARKTVELTYDFRPVKELLIKAEKEKAIQREFQEKENKKAEKERNGAPINRFKEQCMQLGFKAGTQDFGNCVLELNDAK